MWGIAEFFLINFKVFGDITGHTSFSVFGIHVSSHTESKVKEANLEIEMS